MSRPFQPHILHVFSSFGVGGPQVRFAKLAAHLGDRFRHSIVAMDGDYTCRARLDPGLDIAYPATAFCKGRTVANVMRFRKQLRELRPNILVTNNWGSIEWSIANAVPVVRHIHIEDGFGSEERNVQIRRRVWARRAFLRRSTIVVPSHALYRIATKIWRLPEKRVQYIPNGIDCARFARRAGGMKWPGDGVVIGTVAGLRPEKNLSRLLQAFRLVAARHPARLVIVGEGPELMPLQRLADDLGLSERVHFAGHVDSPEMCYRGFDIFALSSDTEQMPLAIIEAMAAGVPIAATNVGDVSEMVADENRRFVTAIDASPLAEALDVLVAERELRQRLGVANQEKAFRCYDDAEMFRAYARVLQAPASAADPGTLVGDANARQSAPENA